MKEFTYAVVGALMIVMLVGIYVLYDKLSLETAALEKVTAQLMEAERKVERRGRILNVFMNGGFDPECKYRREFDEEWADGTVFWQLTKVCEEE